MAGTTDNIPKDLRKRLARESEETKSYVFGIAVQTDPELRRHTRAALEAKHIDVDPLYLEMALYSTTGLYDINSPASIPAAREEREVELTDKRREELDAFFKTLPQELEDIERKEWRWCIINEIQNALYRGAWDTPRLDRMLASGPAWDEALNDQIDVTNIARMAQDGEDPFFLTLLVCNMWGNRSVFQEVVNAVGANILQWDDRRSLVYERLFASLPRQQVLCDEIHVEPAGLAAIEPWRDDRKDQDYDMYGGRISEVSVYSVAYVPKDRKEARTLQKAVEKSIRALAETEFPFTVPDAHYNTNKNSYKRPTSNDDDEDGLPFWREFLEHQEFYHDQLLQDGVFGALEILLKDNKIRDYWESATGERYTNGYGQYESSYLCALWDRELPLPDYVPKWFLKAVHDEQNRRDGIRHTHVDNDGRVMLDVKLALEDVWDLYYLSRGFVEPSEQIAVAFNVARYAEERGPVKRPSDIGQVHDYDATDMDSMLGNLHKIKPEDRLVHGLTHVAMMAGTKAGGIQTSLEQLVALSDATLKGVLVDKTGLFPTYRALTDGRQDNAVTPYAEAAAMRARTMMDAITVMFGEGDMRKPLRERFEAAVQNARQIAQTENLIAQVVWRYEWDTKMREYSSRFSGSGFGRMESESHADSMALKLSDVLSGNFQRFASQHGAYGTLSEDEETPESKAAAAVREGAHKDEERAQKARSFNAVTNRGGLVMWSGKVPPQVDRGYTGTTHVSRSHHSPYARLELPVDLQPFIREAESRAGRERYQLDAPDVIFGAASSTRPRPS